MRRNILPALVVLVCAGSLLAQQDDFRRERGGDNDALKDAIEGRAPPALQASGWLNTDGQALNLADLKGKVVILDFWGTW
ncbi:hypothetical protein ACFL4Y_00330 [Gemmatimonadota bacterium]